MAYYEKYRKNITRAGGPNYRVSIYENRTSALPSNYPMEIGGLVACNLVLQGQRSDVFEPITKTSLELALVDMSDKPTDGSVKQGNWEEFFTPDAMKYKVIVSELTGTSTVTPIWTGYVTPDSYEEQLIYRGTISIIARDNLGHLGDLDFDGTESDSGSGMISVGDIVTQALAKVGAMGLKNLTSDFNTGNHILCQDSEKQLTSVNLKSLYINIAACRGKKWLDVLENVLESAGLTLRYNFDNTFLLAEMGIIPEYLDGTRAGLGNRPFKMIQSSGRRQFIAAARAIKETFDADYGGLLEMNTQSEDYRSATVTMGGQSVSVDEPTGTHPFRRTGAIGMIDPLSGHYYNPRAGSIFYDGADMFITVLKSSDSLSSYGSIKAEIPIAVGGENVTMRFKFYVSAYTHDGDYISNGVIFHAGSIRPGRRPDGAYDQTMTVRYKIAYYDGTTRKYLNDQGIFSTTEYVFTNGVNSGFSSSRGRYGADSADVEKEIRMPNNSGTLEVIFLPCLLTNTYAPSLSTGTYHGRINGLEIVQNDESWKGYHIRTNYNNKNNVMLDREPAFGQVSGVISPRVLRNGLYIKGTNGRYPAAGAFYWRSKSDDNLRLAVLIHQQMLEFFSRPEKQISADIITSDGILSFSQAHIYDGEQYIIQSGSLDLIDNVLRSVVMRTWKSWDELWGDGPVAKYLTVSPSAVDLTNDSPSADLQIQSNTSWRIKSLPSGLSANVTSGTGNTSLFIMLNGSFSGGTVVFETTDQTLTASVSVTKSGEETIGLSITSVGADVEAMEFQQITGVYYVEIDFDPDNDPMVMIDRPSWIHFEDQEAEDGIIYTPGVFGIYCDELPDSNFRDGKILVQGMGSGFEASLYVKQIG